MIDEFTFNRHNVMRMLLEEAGVQKKILLDLGAGPNPITSGVECQQRIFLDIRMDCKPSVVCNFLEGLPLKNNSIHVVVAGEIMEHVAHTRRFLGEIRRVLMLGGELILSVPNIVSLKYRIAFLMGRIPALAARADYTYSPDNPAHPRGHVRDYSFGEMRRVLADHSFRIVAEHSIGMHFNGKRILPPWLIPVTFSDNVIVKAVLQK